jgi:hypothetical protein
MKIGSHEFDGDTLFSKAVYSPSLQVYFPSIELGEFKSNNRAQDLREGTTGTITLNLNFAPHKQSDGDFSGIQQISADAIRDFYEQIRSIRPYYDRNNQKMDFAGLICPMSARVSEVLAYNCNLATEDDGLRLSVRLFSDRMESRLDSGQLNQKLLFRSRIYDLKYTINQQGRVEGSDSHNQSDLIPHLILRRVMELWRAESATTELTAIDRLVIDAFTTPAGG